MVRVSWLVLASCAATPPPRDTAIQSRSGPPGPASVTTTSARLAISGGTRLDLIVDGIDTTSARQCAWLVAHPGPGIPPQARVERACAAQALPPPPLHTALLVTEETIDADSVVVDSLLEGSRPLESDPYLANLHGRRISYQPVEDVPSCERVRRQLIADQEQQDAAFEASTDAGLGAELSEVVVKEAEACQRAADALAACDTKTGDPKKQCILDALQSQYTCEDLKRRHGELDALRRVRPTTRHPTQRCMSAR